MVEGVIMRLATHIDVPAIAKMQVCGWEKDVHKEPIEFPLKSFFLTELKNRWQRQLEKNLQVLVLEVKKNMMGFVAFYLTGEITNIYVMPDLRRQGFGKLLCEKMLAIIMKEVKVISVWLLAADEMTRSFYESLGFNATNESRSDRLDNGIALKEVRYQLVIY